MKTASPPITRLGLIRHAQTLWNLEKRIQGHQDSPLTPHGKQQALKWGQLLKPYPWDRILSSDTGRARKTAVLINETLQLPLSFDPSLREQNWGHWTGLTEKQLTQDFPQQLEQALKKGWDFRPPGGESRRQIWNRSIRTLSDGSKVKTGETILVVTHEGVIKSLVYHLCGRAFLPAEAPLLKPYHLHWLSRAQTELRLESLNALALE